MVSHYYIILYQPLLLTIWLVVNLPSWKIWKSMGRIIPYIMENKKWSKPPTRYIYIYTYYSKYYWNKNNCWKSCSQHAMQMGNPHRRWIGLPFQPTEARMNPIKHGTHTNIDINMNINININITINIKYEYIIYILDGIFTINHPQQSHWLVNGLSIRSQRPAVKPHHDPWGSAITLGEIPSGKCRANAHLMLIYPLI